MADARKKTSVSDEDVAKIAKAVNFVTLCEGAKYSGFLEFVTKEDSEDIAHPPSMKSPHSHVMKDIREEREDARDLAWVHNDSDESGSGVIIQVLDNMTEGKITKGVDPDFPDGINDATLFRLEFQGKSTTISVGSGRNAGASIAGIRLATSLMMEEDEEGIRESNLDRKLSGTMLPDERILAWDMESASYGSDGTPIGVPMMIAFLRNDDHRYFIEGYEAAAALFADVAAVKKAA